MTVSKKILSSQKRRKRRPQRNKLDCSKIWPMRERLLWPNNARRTRRRRLRRKRGVRKRRKMEKTRKSISRKVPMMRLRQPVKSAIKRRKNAKIARKGRRLKKPRKSRQGKRRKTRRKPRTARRTTSRISSVLPRMILTTLRLQITHLCFPRSSLKLTTLRLLRSRTENLTGPGSQRTRRRHANRGRRKPENPRIRTARRRTRKARRRGLTAAVAVTVTMMSLRENSKTDPARINSEQHPPTHQGALPGSTLSSTHPPIKER